jgi:phage antirepressor YoqD-like protein
MTTTHYHHLHNYSSNLNHIIGANYIQLTRDTQIMTTTINHTIAANTKITNPFLLTPIEDMDAPDLLKTLTLYGALKLVSELETERQALSTRVKALEEQFDRPCEKQQLHDDLTNTKELFDTGLVGKTLGIGKTRFCRRLRELKVLMPGGNKKGLPYQKHIDAGWLDVRWIQVLNRQTGERKYTPVPLFTGKGIIWIKRLIEKSERLA